VRGGEYNRTEIGFFPPTAETNTNPRNRAIGVARERSSAVGSRSKNNDDDEKRIVKEVRN